MILSTLVAIMFVQATKSRRQNKTYVSYLVRESFRTAQGPRSRTVCNISALPSEVRDLVAAALSGKSCVALEQIELSSALDYGGLATFRYGEAFCRCAPGSPAPAFAGHDLWTHPFSVRKTGVG